MTQKQIDSIIYENDQTYNFLDMLIQKIQIHIHQRPYDSTEYACDLLEEIQKLADECDVKLPRKP